MGSRADGAGEKQRGGGKENAHFCAAVAGQSCAAKPGDAEFGGFAAKGQTVGLKCLEPLGLKEKIKNEGVVRRGLLRGGKGLRWIFTFIPEHPVSPRDAQDLRGFIHVQGKLGIPSCGHWEVQRGFSVGSSLGLLFPQRPKTSFSSRSARFPAEAAGWCCAFSSSAAGGECLEIVNPKNAAEVVVRWEGDGVGL